MPNMGFLILIGLVALVTLLSGVASVGLALVPDLAASPHSGALIQMFADTWKQGVVALISLLAGWGAR